MLSWACAALLAVGAPPPKVAYRVKASVGSWQPLEAADLAKTIEHAALEVLSQPALMQLEAGQGAADYRLDIQGRLLDEAETHTVYLVFGAGARSDLPSFNASHTVVLSKLGRGAMLERIDQSARKAAAQLLAALEGPLRHAGKAGVEEVGGAAPAVAPKELPFQWAEVRIPAAVGGFQRASGDLHSKSAAERQAALRELTSEALIAPSPRNVLEACVLHHTDPATRLGCLVALRPLSRTIAPTQRVVIEALRRDPDSKVVQEANEQMLYFSGASRAEAVQAWLEKAARAEVIGPLDELGDIPNLDPAIAHCLLAAGKRPKYQRSKRACIELLKAVPTYARRRALLWRALEETNAEAPLYLEGAGKHEGSTGTDWQWAQEALLEKAAGWDPEFEEIVWRRYQRELSASSLDILCDYGTPSERLAGRLLEIVQTAGDRRALWGLERFAKADPKLIPMIKEKLAELEATSAYPKELRPESLKELQKKLEQVQK
jgi:hypothetical protein